MATNLLCHLLILAIDEPTFFVQDVSQHPQSRAQLCDGQETAIVFVLVVGVGYVFNLRQRREVILHLAYITISEY